MSVYFVTGVTGIVGSAVVERLLRDPTARIVALVRAPTPEAAAQRVDATLTALSSTALDAPTRARVQALRGDAEQAAFGLAPGEYRALADACTNIVHCAGAVRLNLPIDAARRAAVDSARHVLELARHVAAADRPVKVELVSTVGVGGRTHRRLAETWIDAGHAFHNTYEQAKAEAEALAHAAADAGLPLTVHRPSMVVGESRSGRALQFQVFYYLVDFLSGRRTGGFFPSLKDARLDIVPVDFVAEAIVRSSASAASAGRVLHLCAGPQEALPLRRLQEVIAERLARRGVRVPRPRFVSPRLFRGATRALRPLAPARTRAALATLPVFLDYLATDQTFENARTLAWLRDVGIDLPPTNEYLPRVLDFYFDARERSSRRAGAGSAPRTA